jgi:hypothetical protein
MNKQEIRKMVGNQFFSAVFVKRNGEVRTMLCRLGVKKHLKGGTKKYDYDHLMTVYDVKKKGYRTINMDTLLQVKANGKVIKVK